jgi:hypothetical protein
MLLYVFINVLLPFGGINPSFEVLLLWYARFVLAKHMYW